MVRVLGKMSWLELKLFGREPLTVLFTTAIPVILLFILGGVFGNTPDPDVYRGVGPMDFYVPAYISLVVASLGLIGIPVHLASYRERGVLRRFRASSVGLPNILASQAAVMLVMAIVGGFLLILLAALVYDINAPVSPLLAVPAFVLSTLCFAALGVMLGSIFPRLVPPKASACCCGSSCCSSRALVHPRSADRRHAAGGSVHAPHAYHPSSPGSVAGPGLVLDGDADRPRGHHGGGHRESPLLPVGIAGQLLVVA